MRPLRVLVVDDSAMNRRTLSEMLTELPGVQVAGVAGDGEEALRLAASLTPDLITLDLEMPRMDGFTFLRLLMASRPTPVVVVSSHSDKGNVFRALELGAIDFIAKPETQLLGQTASVRAQLTHMISIVRQLAPTSMGRGRSQPIEVPREAKSDAPARMRGEPARIVVIASSTGGPTALLDLFARLPANANACVIVAQHMPERFTRAFAERLDRLSPFHVTEAEGTTVLRQGLGLVCPGGKCIEVDVEAGQLVAKVVEPLAGDRYAPSADRLFLSAANTVGSRTLAVVLTGMGDDGSQGVVAIKNAQGCVVVESAETAVIYGMPRSAKQTGSTDQVLPLPQLIDWLGHWVLSGERRS